MNTLREADKIVVLGAGGQKLYIFGNSDAMAKLQREKILNSLTVYAFLIM